MLTCLQIVLMDELIVCKPCGITFFPKNFFLLEKNERCCAFDSGTVPTANTVGTKKAPLARGAYLC